MTRQSGAIIVRTRGGEPNVLLVTAKRNNAHWLFPKGHIEKGETLEEAALREAEEEAGVTGTLRGPAGTLAFTLRAESFLVHYFLLLTEDEGRPEKGRKMRWCSYEDAMALLTFEDSRALLRQARARLEEERLLS